MRAYWSAASRNDWPRVLGRISKNLLPPGHLPLSGLGRAGRSDPSCSAANGGDVPIATLGFSGLPR